MLPFHSLGTVSCSHLINYGSILYHFQDKSILAENPDFFTLPAFDTPEGSPLEYCHTVCYCRKTRMVLLTDGEKSLMIMSV